MLIDIRQGRLMQISDDPGAHHHMPSLQEILEARQHAYVLMEEGPQTVRQYLQQTGLVFKDFSALVGDHCEFLHQAATALHQTWEAFCQAAQQAPEEKTYVVLLPHCSDAAAAHDFFNAIRVKLQEWHEYSQPKLIFLGNEWTFNQMLVEGREDSGLGKEFIAMNAVWLFETLYPKNNAIEWLTGGDAGYIRALDAYCNHISAATAGQSLRSAVHTLMAQVLSDDKPSEVSLRGRLYQMLNQACTQQATLPEPNQKRLAQYLEILYTLLPGNYDAGRAESRQAWRRQKREARWKPFFSAQPPYMQSLLTNGFLRYELDWDQVYLRLRSPLLAYAVAYHGMQTGHLRSHAPWRKALFSVSLDSFVALPDTPTSLDAFIDKLLDKAMDLEDGEEDHWTVEMSSPAWTDSTKQLDAGYWWERVRLQEPIF